MRIGGGVYERVWAQPSIRDRRLLRRHHDKGIQGSAAIHPIVVSRQGCRQGQSTGSLLGPTPDRVEYGLLGVLGIAFSRAPSAFAVASALTPGWG